MTNIKCLHDFIFYTTIIIYNYLLLLYSNIYLHGTSHNVSDET